MVLKDGAKSRADADETVAWGRENMAAYKVPRLIESTDSLPKSETGKVQWRLLQEREDRNNEREQGR